MDTQMTLPARKKGKQAEVEAFAFERGRQRGALKVLFDKETIPDQHKKHVFCCIFFYSPMSKPVVLAIPLLFFSATVESTPYLHRERASFRC